MAVLAPIAANIVVSAGVSFGMSLLNGPKDPSTYTLTASSPPPPPDYSLNVTADPGGPVVGIFGNRRVGGRVVFQTLSGSTTYAVIAIANYPVTAINGIYINNRLVTRNGSNQVTTFPWFASGPLYPIKVRLYDGTQVANDTALTTALPNWTSAFIGKWTAYAVVEIDLAVAANVSNLFNGALPNFTFDVSGFKCYDPRDGTQTLGTTSTYKFTHNAALIAANYIIHPLGMALPTSAVDWTSVTSAANTCDENVTLKLGGNEIRFAGNLYWKTDERHEDVLYRIEQAMAGRVMRIGGLYRVFAGAYNAPGLTPTAITVDDYAGEGLAWQDTPDLANSINGVRGKFSSPANNWELTDFPAYQDATALSQDNGVENWQDLELDCVTSHTQAQRLAKIAFNRMRNGAPASVDLNFGFFDTVAGDLVAITDKFAQFNAATFRVLKEEVSTDMVVRLSLRTELSTFYDWTAASDEKTFVYTPSPEVDESMVAPGIFVVDNDATAGVKCEAKVYYPPGSIKTTNYNVTAGAPLSRAQNVVYPAAITTFNVADGGAANVGTWTINVTSYASGLAITQSFGFNTAAGGAPSTINGKDETTTPLYLPCPPSRPRIVARRAGEVTVRVDQINGPRITHIRAYSSAAPDITLARTLISTTAWVAGGINITLTGAAGSSFVLWVASYNNTDAIAGPPADPILIAF